MCCSYPGIVYAVTPLLDTCFEGEMLKSSHAKEEESQANWCQHRRMHAHAQYDVRQIPHWRICEGCLGELNIRQCVFQIIMERCRHEEGPDGRLSHWPQQVKWLVSLSVTPFQTLTYRIAREADDAVGDHLGEDRAFAQSSVVKFDQAHFVVLRWLKLEVVIVDMWLKPSDISNK